MQTFNAAPLFFRRFENRLAPGGTDYNLMQTGENDYRITFAVPGFTQDEISIETHENALWVTGNEKTEDSEPEYLYRGLAKGEFKRQFYLPEHVRVTNATLENGLLHIDLVREVPEALQPRKIEVTVAGSPVLQDASKAA